MVRRPHKLKIAEILCQVNTGSELWQAYKCSWPHNAAPSEKSCRGMNYGKLTDVVSPHHSKAAPSEESCRGMNCGKLTDVVAHIIQKLPLLESA